MRAEIVVRDALQEIGQQAAEQPVQSDEMATGIRNLNRLMSGYANLGLGYTILSSGSDEVTIPTYAEDWIILALAKRLSAQFPSLSDSDKISLDNNLKVAWNNLLENQQVISDCTYPSTLPIGSGNQGVFGNRFYPIDDNNILAEDGDNILLEEA